MERPPYSITRCTHYVSSVANCRVGINPTTLLDVDGRTPCVIIRGVTGTQPCDRRSFPSKPLPGERGTMAKQLDAILDRRCPRCNEPIVAEMELHGSIVARPCQHVIRSAL